MPNQYKNKIIYGDQTLIDLTNDTIVAEKMLAGVTAHNKAGAPIVGTILTKNNNDIILSNKTIIIPAGYYASTINHTIQGIELITPTIGTNSFFITLPNGDNTITLTFIIDTQGNSIITNSDNIS